MAEVRPQEWGEEMKRKTLMFTSAVVVLFAASACSTGSTAAEATGDLSTIQAQSQGLPALREIGRIHVQEPGTGVWDYPEGVTVGRLADGTYPVYETRDGWLEVAIVGQNSEPAFGWVPAVGVQLEVGD